MPRYLLRRLLLAVITLWILVTVVFAIVNVLPNDVGRSVLGPFATPEDVKAFNHRLGTDQPITTQYAHSLRQVVTFDYGDSYSSRTPVAPIVLGALWRSAKLAGLALLMTVPISILMGIFAARHRDRLADRSVVVVGLASSSIPEFVTGTILAVVVGVKLGWLPVVARAPEGAGPLEQIKYLILPASAMAIAYFGYIARMARAGTIATLNSDYVRTARMKGLSDRYVMRKHVVRNALVPTVAVVGVQIGYLFGGLVGVEKIFNYPGLGLTLLQAVSTKDIPVLTAGIIVVGIVYMLATLGADMLISWMNPRARIAGENH